MLIDCPAKAELVKLDFFAGLTWPEVATVMKVSLAKRKRYLFRTVSPRVPGRFYGRGTDRSTTLTNIKVQQ